MHSTEVSKSQLYDLQKLSLYVSCTSCYVWADTIVLRTTTTVIYISITSAKTLSTGAWSRNDVFLESTLNAIDLRDRYTSAGLTKTNYPDFVANSCVLYIAQCVPSLGWLALAFGLVWGRLLYRTSIEYEKVKRINSLTWGWLLFMSCNRVLT